MGGTGGKGAEIGPCPHSSQAPRIVVKDRLGVAELLWLQACSPSTAATLCLGCDKAWASTQKHCGLRGSFLRLGGWTQGQVEVPPQGLATGTHCPCSSLSASWMDREALCRLWSQESWVGVPTLPLPWASDTWDKEPHLFETPLP